MYWKAQVIEQWADESRPRTLIVRANIYEEALARAIHWCRRIAGGPQVGEPWTDAETLSVTYLAGGSQLRFEIRSLQPTTGPELLEAMLYECRPSDQEIYLASEHVARRGMEVGA